MENRLVVVKIGTRCLITEKGSLDLKEMDRLVEQIAHAVKQGFKIIIVTSGAIASGIAELGVTANPKDIIFKQACASIGQSILMVHYREMFRQRGLKVAQVLLTESDLSNRTSYLHICNVLDRLLRLEVVPIINENDVTSVNEILPVTIGYKVNFSDNDILSALIASAIEADLIVILSNVNGLYSKNPRKPGAELIRIVEKITPELREVAEGRGKLGRGGMKTKLQAAEIAMQSGIPLIIANSRRENVLIDALNGKNVGTYFKPAEKAIPRMKRWIAYGAIVKGHIYINEGARQAILKGASLLAIGIENVSGQFQVGDVVTLTTSDGKEFAKGITNYTSDEIKLIKGKNTSQISKILGYIRQKEIVTRKHMYLVNGGISNEQPDN